MWLLLACGSALFAGITSILAKCGIQKTDSDVATAIRTGVVLLCSIVMVFLVGSQKTIARIDFVSWTFLILSGLATGASWICYFRALQTGPVNKVVPIDKSSTVLTILLALIFFQEGMGWGKLLAITAIGLGTWLMIQPKAENKAKSAADRSWLLYAVLSAVFASLTAILGKVGITGVESNLGTAIRTVVVLCMAWFIVLSRGKQTELKKIPVSELIFICLSGVATGASWLCFYRALQQGPASVIVPIDKLSILVTILFSWLVFGEKLSRKEGVGLCLIVAGTLAMALG